MFASTAPKPIGNKSNGSNPLRIAKNSNPNSSTNVVFYIGDPAIKLAIPKSKIRLTKVNDIPVSQTIEDFKSLARIKLSGEVIDENDNLLTNYNGAIATAISFRKSISTTKCLGIFISYIYINLYLN